MLIWYSSIQDNGREEKKANGTKIMYSKKRKEVFRLQNLFKRE